MRSKSFGDLIRKARKQRGLKLREVAGKLEIDQSTLSKIERNEIIAPPRIIRPIAKLLGIDYKSLQVKYLSEKLFYDFKEVDYAVDAIDEAKRMLLLKRKDADIASKKELLIRKIKNYLNNQPIDKAWLFGSFARNQESFHSDIDLLVRFIKPNQLDLFDYAGFKLDLEDITGRPVDLVEEGYMIPGVKKNVDNEKVLIYERKAG